MAAAKYSALAIVVGDGQPPLDGGDVLREVGDLLREKLPRIPVDDPFRGALQSLLSASGARLRPTHERGGA